MGGFASHFKFLIKLRINIKNYYSIKTSAKFIFLEKLPKFNNSLNFISINPRNNSPCYV